MRTAACTFLLFAFGVANATEDQFTDVMVCSKYFFHDERFDWSTAREKCSDEENSSLVSMETEKEWHFVHNLLTKLTKVRWFIGLERVNKSYSWSWLSECIACVNETSTGTWRWNTGEPNNIEKEKCGEMWKNGKYNSIPCQAYTYDDNPGYICEKHFNCSTISNNSEKEDIFIERTTRPRSTPQPLATKTTSNSLRTRLTNTRKKFSEGTTFETAECEYSPQNVSTGTLNLVLIVIVLLTIFILAITVAFGILLFRRHQGGMNQDAESTVSKESSKKRDFRDSLPLATLNGCAQSIFSVENEAMIERFQSEPPFQREGLYAPLRHQSLMTSEGDDSRTYASIDKSTRQAKDVEYEIPVPTQRIQQRAFVQREGVYTTLCPEPMMASKGEDSQSCKSTVEDSDIKYVNQIPNPEYVNQIPTLEYVNARVDCS